MIVESSSGYINQGTELYLNINVYIRLNKIMQTAFTTVLFFKMLS